MERILIRAGVAPWAEYNALDVITDKIIGNNTGNLLFANSITRLVATADSRVDFISDLMLVKKQITAQEINENYDRLILPMANAFREDFARKCLKHWTALIRQLTIPVTVTGIGIQLPYEPHLEQPREFDGAARDFIAAVLDHSASVGVRGQITYDYLKGLGFSQIDVTGCPSLALNGPGLPLREKQPLTPESKLCFTGSVSNPPDFKKFAVHCTERFPNTYFVPQFIDDLRLMYLGIPHPDTADSRVLHPTNLDHPVFVEDKARFFINLPSMFAFNREMDFNLMLQSGYVSYYYEYASGIKTGSTEEAGYCVITKASKDGYNYLAVVLGAPVIDYNSDGYVEKCSFIDAASLFDWAFDSLKYTTLVSESDVIDEVPVENGKDADAVQLVAEKDVNTIVPAGLDKSAVIIRAVDKPESVQAPVEKGQKICKAEIVYADQVVATVQLVAANRVELSTFLKILNAVKAFFSLTVVRIVLGAAVLFVLVYLYLFIRNARRKSKRRAEKMRQYEEMQTSGNRDQDGPPDLPPPVHR